MKKSDRRRERMAVRDDSKSAVAGQKPHPEIMSRISFTSSIRPVPAVPQATLPVPGPANMTPRFFSISTFLSIASTYIIDALTKKQTDKFINNFISKNKNDLKLSKYIEGIKVAKPIAIVGIVYYIAIPIISTFLADKFTIKK